MRCQEVARTRQVSMLATKLMSFSPGSSDANAVKLKPSRRDKLSKPRVYPLQKWFCPINK